MFDDAIQNNLYIAFPIFIFKKKMCVCILCDYITNSIFKICFCFFLQISETVEKKPEFHTFSYVTISGRLYDNYCVVHSTDKRYLRLVSDHFGVISSGKLQPYSFNVNGKFYILIVKTQPNANITVVFKTITLQLLLEIGKKLLMVCIF